MADVAAHITGTVWKIEVTVGQTVNAGDTVTPFYDSLLAKIISHGKNREEATARLRKALESFVVDGVKTNLPLHQKILASDAFARGELDTHFLERI